jgi:hypothetical protein
MVKVRLEELQRGPAAGFGPPARHAARPAG